MTPDQIVKQMDEATARNSLVVVTSGHGVCVSWKDGELGYFAADSVQQVYSGEAEVITREQAISRIAERLS